MICERRDIWHQLSVSHITKTGVSLDDQASAGHHNTKHDSKFSHICAASQINKPTVQT